MEVEKSKKVEKCSVLFFKEWGHRQAGGYRLFLRIFPFIFFDNECQEKQPVEQGE